MSQENVEIVRRIHGLWDSGGQLAAATELLDPGIEWVNPDDAVEPGIRRGLANVLDAAESVNLSFENIDVVVVIEHRGGLGGQVAGACDGRNPVSESIVPTSRREARHRIMSKASRG